MTINKKQANIWKIANQDCKTDTEYRQNDSGSDQASSLVWNKLISKNRLQESVKRDCKIQPKNWIILLNKMVIDRKQANKSRQTARIA